MSKYVEIRQTSRPADGDDSGFLEYVKIDVTLRLKLCPLCGGEAESKHEEPENPEDDDLLRIHCKKCGFETAAFTDYESITEAWNMRKSVLTVKKGAMKACPLCGGKAEYGYSEIPNEEEGSSDYIIECTKCGARTSSNPEWKKVLAQWNHRV